MRCILTSRKVPLKNSEIRLQRVEQGRRWIDDSGSGLIVRVLQKLHCTTANCRVQGNNDYTESNSGIRSPKTRPHARNYQWNHC